MGAKKKGVCNRSKCRQPSEIIYLGEELCSMHWEQQCNDDMGITKPFIAQ